MWKVAKRNAKAAIKQRDNNNNNNRDTRERSAKKKGAQKWEK